MNALWLDRIYKYKNSVNNLETLKAIVQIKIDRENFLLKKYKFKPSNLSTKNAKNINELLLVEARSARQLWQSFVVLFSSLYGFNERKARKKNIINEFLDIGFHHISTKVRNILDEHKIPTSVGLMHVPHRSDSDPLVYDIVELFRADLVATEVLKFLNLKKKPVKEINSKTINHFLGNLNKRMKKKFYLKEFKQCQTYKYYMELQILKIIKAVDHLEVFQPIILPTRHDSRCK